VAADPVRRDEGVPEFARVPVGTAEGSAGADDPAADAARAAVQVHEVVDAAGAAVQPFRPGAEVGVVRGPDRHAQAFREWSGEGLVTPAEVWGVAHGAVLDPHDAGHGDTDPDDPGPGCGAGDECGEDPGDGVDRLRRGGHGGLRLDQSVADGAVEADEGDPDSVDLDRDRSGEDVGGGPDDAARPSDARTRGPRCRGLLVHETGVDEFPDEREDRRAVQAGAPGELGAGDGAVLVDEPEDAGGVARCRGRLPCHGSSSLVGEVVDGVSG
jgi:hypothetical protein